MAESIWRPLLRAVRTLQTQRESTAGLEHTSFRAILFVFVLAFISTLPSSVIARWEFVTRLEEGVSCGFLIDEENILLGTGSVSFVAATPSIYRSTDGGKTWTRTVTPPISGAAVTSIMMKDRLVGYASIYYGFGSIWKTIDGGASWNELDFGEDPRGTCATVSDRAVLLTTWRQLSGSNRNSLFLSENGGINWRSLPLATRTSGIAFTDGLTGVVSTYAENNGRESFYYTKDGGLSWRASGVVPEAWSVYGLEGTQTFFSANEGGFNSPDQTIRRSTNGGANWQDIYRFPTSNMMLTGHIGGKSNILYVQQAMNNSSGGLHRSDDNGLSWIPVGGPRNFRDTRFVVGGCVGELIYAFDEQGGVWRTYDGGDGSICRPLASQLEVVDSVDFFANSCDPEVKWIQIRNLGCARDTAVSVGITGDLLSEFTSEASRSLHCFEGDSVRVVFDPMKVGRREATVTYTFRSGTSTLRKTVVLTGVNVAFEPYFKSIPTAFAGDTVRIPIYLNEDADALNLRSYSLGLRFNTDVLHPIGFDATGTLSAAESIAFTPDPAGARVRVELLAPPAQPVDYQRPLIYFVARAMISTTLETPLVLDTVSTGGFKPLRACVQNSAFFRVDPQCGDSSIMRWMGNTPLLKLMSIIPNPVSSAHATVHFKTSEECRVEITLNDLAGREISAMQRVVSPGEHSETIDVRELKEGTYIVRMRANDLVVETGKFVKVR